MERALQPRLLLGSELDRTLELLSKPSEIAALAKRAQPLLTGLGSTEGPRFFLASIAPDLWIPRVVVVKRGSRIEGIVYTKERKLAGLATGILFGHSTLGTLVVAEPGCQEQILQEALNFLLASRRVRGIRMLVPPQGYEVRTCEYMALLSQGSLSPGSPSQSSRCQIELSQRVDSSHHVVPLPSGYESFLNGLSYKARRNMRYYRRRFEAAGHRYVERMDLDEFRRVANRLMEKPVMGGNLNGNQGGVARALSMFSEADHPLLAGLRRADGEWVSILGGWCESDGPIVVFQMNNDHDYGSESLSVVLRAFFIETLISQGHRQVFFWGGVGGPVGRGARPYPSITVSLDAGTRSWRALRQLLVMLGPWLPQRLRWAVEWIAPGPAEHLAPVAEPT